MFELTFNFANCFSGCTTARDTDSEIACFEEDSLPSSQFEKEITFIQNVPHIKLDFEYSEIHSVFVNDYLDKYIVLETKGDNKAKLLSNKYKNKHISSYLPKDLLKEYHNVLVDTKKTKTNKQIIYFSDGLFKILDILPINYEEKILGTITIERIKKTLNLKND